MFNKRNLVIVMAILVLGTFSLFAGLRTADIVASGNVQTNGSAPMAGILVELVVSLPSGSYPASSSYTDANGDYVLTASLPTECTSFKVVCSPGMGYSPEISSSSACSIPPFDGTYTYSNIDFVFQSGTIYKK